MPGPGSERGCGSNLREVSIMKQRAFPPGVLKHSTLAPPGVLLCLPLAGELPEGGNPPNSAALACATLTRPCQDLGEEPGSAQSLRSCRIRERPYLEATSQATATTMRRVAGGASSITQRGKPGLRSINMKRTAFIECSLSAGPVQRT